MSGYYVDYNVDKLPNFLQKTLDGLSSFSYSNVFQNNQSVYLIYKYKQTQEDQLTLNNDYL